MTENTNKPHILRLISTLKKDLEGPNPPIGVGVFIITDNGMTQSILAGDVVSPDGLFAATGLIGILHDFCREARDGHDEESE